MAIYKDMKGCRIQEGQKVLKAHSAGHLVYLKEREVVRVDETGVYLDGARQVKLRYPDRIWVI